MHKPTTLASILPPVNTPERDALDATLAQMSHAEYAGWCQLHNDAIEREIDEGLAELETLSVPALRGIYTTRME